MCRFDKFSQAYEFVSHSGVSFEGLEDFVQSTFEVQVPQVLKEFWDLFVPGYYGRKELFFFGNESHARSSFMELNCLDSLRKQIPTPKQGGPVFFCETCFGDLLGFAWLNDVCTPLLLVIDTMSYFVLAERFELLFTEILSQPAALCDPDRFEAVLARLGPIPDGMNYGLIHPLQMGGNGEAENFELRPAKSRLILALELCFSASKLPVGAQIDGIILDPE